MKKLVETYEKVREETVRGAFWSAYVMAKAVIEDAQEGSISCNDIAKITRLITSANITMASLWNLADILREGCKSGYDLLSSARKFLWYMNYSRELLSSSAYNIAHEGMVVTTLSYSSSVELVLLTLKEYLKHIFISISEPGGEGVELARNLRRAGMTVNIIYDSMMPHAVEKSTIVLIGADSVTLDECIFNKVGSLALAIMAHEYNVLFVPVFEAFKIHGYLKCNDVKIEYRSARIDKWGDTFYPLFDKVPSLYIRFMLTEYGAIEPGKNKLAEVLSKMRELINES